MVTVIILVIVITLAVVGVLTLRMFSFERITTTVSEDAAEADPEGGEEADEGEESETPAEMVDLFDYFDENPEDADDNKDDANNADGSLGSSDKLTDFRTGRRYLVDCHKTLSSAREDGHIYCAVYFDYDRFSYINSLKGAATGDYVLTNTSQQIRRIFPDGALMSRISCDHFAAIFPLVDLSLFADYYEQLRRMCEKIRNDIASKSGLRICVGFATTDNDASYDVNVLLTRANIARHCVKVTKAEKFETYDETMVSSNFYGDSMMDTYSECQYADDFSLYFELILDLGSDKLVGCDSLVRWSCEDSSQNPITTDTGKIPTNNDKIIYQVCRSVSRFRKAAREIMLMFVDVPVTDLFKVDIDEFLGKCFTEFQVDPATIVLKIDVGIVRIDWSMCSKQFKKFRELGVKICVSGMDTGYSSLEFLSGLSIDYVKLHKSFAYGVERSHEQLDRCRKIVERATQIGARVIFEGVDNMEQVAALRTINVKIIQGKYTGRTSTTDDLVRDLPEHVERRLSDQTVILDEKQLAKGEWTLF